MAIKIEVTIDIGRKAHGCTRFGICSITIGAELALKPNQDPGLVEWEQGADRAKLYWRGKESLTEQGIAAVIVDRAVYVPFPCTGSFDWFIRRGKYAVRQDNGGEYIEFQLGAIAATN